MTDDYPDETAEITGADPDGNAGPNADNSQNMIREEQLLSDGRSISFYWFRESGRHD